MRVLSLLLLIVVVVVSRRFLRDTFFLQDTSADRAGKMAAYTLNRTISAVQAASWGRSPRTEMRDLVLRKSDNTLNVHCGNHRIKLSHSVCVMIPVLYVPGTIYVLYTKYVYAVISVSGS